MNIPVYILYIIFCCGEKILDLFVEFRHLEKLNKTLVSPLLFKNVFIMYKKASFEIFTTVNIWF